jgi:alkanesulfonate monooxygenase SsuD/methylene tetrahydromethanopterin reductase-like flavin-dependent oxidoreductase (luciferase family)
MQYGFVIPGGDAAEIVEMGVEIEKAGWDAAFGWETVYGLDPWVLLGAMATRTSRVRLGTLLTPPSRRRPWKLAAEVATLDRLSNGRAQMIVGLGATMTGFAEVGEETDRKIRAELLDESLSLMQLFWNSEPFTHEGKHYQVDWSLENWKLEPVQQPRVPIWTVALWPSEKSMNRAFRLDGCLPYVRGATEMENALTPEQVAEIRRKATERRPEGAPFDIVIEGVTPPGDEAALEKVRAMADAGATWWVESMWDNPGGLDAVRERIKAGPPKL